MSGSPYRLAHRPEMDVIWMDEPYLRLVAIRWRETGHVAGLIVKDEIARLLFAALESGQS